MHGLESFIILGSRGWGGCYVFPLYVIFANAVKSRPKKWELITHNSYNGSQYDHYLITRWSSTSGTQSLPKMVSPWLPANAIEHTYSCVNVNTVMWPLKVKEVKGQFEHSKRAPPRPFLIYHDGRCDGWACFHLPSRCVISYLKLLSTQVPELVTGQILTALFSFPGVTGSVAWSRERLLLLLLLLLLHLPGCCGQDCYQ